MKHVTSSDFWASFHSLPKSIQELARKNFVLLKSNPKHPSLHPKKIAELWTVRVGIHYRAIGIDTPEGIQWIWIGSHETYNKYFSRALSKNTFMFCSAETVGWVASF